MKTYRIHPAIGVARLGNADRTDPDGMFIGPEVPGVPANFDTATQKFGSFKLQGRVKAQGARFRIWEYEDVGGILKPVREINLDSAEVTGLEWKVTLANRKASFFKFEGQKGATDNFATNTRRNASVPDADRRKKLEMEETGVISGKSTTRKELRNSNTNIPIGLLGELRTDEAGRLIVLGGEGVSKSISGATLDDYANNDDWFDDISDGTVDAKLTLKNSDGTVSDVPVEGAWVLVAPPDFAPSIGNVVNLYDTLWSGVVQNGDVPSNEAVYLDGGALHNLKVQRDSWQTSQALPAEYLPSFVWEILPILKRGLDMGWVYSQLKFDSDGPTSFHFRLSPDQWGAMAIPSSPAAVRNSVFRRMQVPGADSVWNAMPRSLGDEPYGGGLKSQVLLTLTPIQYAILQKWKDGKFANDPPYPATGLPMGPDITPWGLDRAALENCVGGAFFPGIEASWLVRRKEIYSSPFRIKRGAKIGSLEVVAGFFSQQMALPWQADFMLCKKEKAPPSLTIPAGQDVRYAWWPAQRPDDVFVGSDASAMEPWARGLENGVDLVNQWSTRGFVINEGDRHFETEGPPSPSPAV